MSIKLVIERAYNTFELLRICSSDIYVNEKTQKRFKSMIDELRDDYKNKDLGNLQNVEGYFMSYSDLKFDSNNIFDSFNTLFNYHPVDGINECYLYLLDTKLFWHCVTSCCNNEQFNEVFNESETKTRVLQYFAFNGGYRLGYKLYMPINKVEYRFKVIGLKS